MKGWPNKGCGPKGGGATQLFKKLLHKRILKKKNHAVLSFSQPFRKQVWPLDSDWTGEFPHAPNKITWVI